MNKFICLHGHFYQPPRENPWTGQIEAQPSANPFHDWNERVTSECYSPNGGSKVIKGETGEEKIINNYSQISFNFGPTLLNWLKDNHFQTYNNILAADEESRKNFGGFGSAIAQGYHHVILPLANERDKRTQIIWGIEDFKYHFKREPKGMWLPETAVDMQTLEMLAEHGIKYTILSPNQAKSFRPVGGGHWTGLIDSKIDTSVGYLCRLASKREINLFFYNGNLAHEVAFGKLLKKSEKFALRLIGSLDEANKGELIHFATDGETYGHHHKFGNMALSYMINYVKDHQLARFTNYEEYLSQNPAAYEVKINENTSWSCSHGVERWRADCGCKLNTEAVTSQQWREYLREALDWLRDEIAPKFEETLARHFDDPWAIRNEYVHLMMGDHSKSPQEFLNQFSKDNLNCEQVLIIMKYLEVQKLAMMMFTSCGWFFDDISGIETVQILQYASKAIMLHYQLTGQALEEIFLEKLSLAESNAPEFENGKHVYEELVKSKIPPSYY